MQLTWPSYMATMLSAKFNKCINVTFKLSLKIKGIVHVSELSDTLWSFNFFFGL